MDTLDLEKLKLKGQTGVLAAVPRVKSGVKFLKGPIPLPWLSRAALLPGKALHVALALWFLSGLTKSRTVRLSKSTLEYFGVKRQASYRSLKALEGVGLIACSRSPGRCPIVTLKVEGEP